MGYWSRVVTPSSRTIVTYLTSIIVSSMNPLVLVAEPPASQSAPDALALVPLHEP